MNKIISFQLGRLPIPLFNTQFIAKASLTSVSLATITYIRGLEPNNDKVKSAAQALHALGVFFFSTAVFYRFPSQNPLLMKEVLDRGLILYAGSGFSSLFGNAVVSFHHLLKLEKPLNHWVQAGDSTENREGAKHAILTCYAKRSPVLSLNNLHLKSIPEMVGGFSWLSSLCLENNPITSLPNTIIQLPTTCRVYIHSTNLSHQVLQNLREETTTPGYQGPRLFFSMTSFEASSLTVRSMEELLAELFKISKQKRFPLQELLKSSEKDKSALKSWLSRLSHVADFRSKGTRRKGLSRKIISTLKLANDNEEFRATFFRVIHGAAETCGDRMALSILHVGIQRKLNEVVKKGDYKKIAEFLKRGIWAIEMLEKVASNKVTTLKFVDPIEVYLGYPVMLKATLQLPIDIEEMLYARCSNITSSDLQNAVGYIQDQWKEPDNFYNFLVKNATWVGVLEKKFPKGVEQARNLRLSLYEEGKVAQAQPEYEKNLQLLTKKLLKKV